MAISTLKGKTVDAKLWTPIEEVESSALDQLRNIASLPWVFHHVAVMPDVHFGMGATVGSVIAMKGAVTPAAVGVDIGCGMAAIQTNLKASDLPESLKDLRHSFERSVPVGFNAHDDSPALSMAHHLADTLPLVGMDVQNEALSLFSEFAMLHPKVQQLDTKAMRQCGTLGAGNHFIEICLDSQQNVWLMLHSGSRNIGKSLAEIHIAVAKELTHNAYLPDADLAAFLVGTPEMEAYRRDLFWAQRYAMLNRKVMLSLLMKDLKYAFPQVEFEPGIYCHHNYVSEETHFGENVIVTRKGAISARKGEMGIIPGSMGTRSYIVRGLGNEESFTSASHGAGRRMSRNKAKKQYTIADVEAQTKGVECRKDAGIIDEIPAAYKDIEKVIEYQKDLIEVVAELKQVLCVKG
jgi:tRNA-splicing ligase RtcB